MEQRKQYLKVWEKQKTSHGSRRHTCNFPPLNGTWLICVYIYIYIIYINISFCSVFKCLQVSFESAGSVAKVLLIRWATCANSSSFASWILEISSCKRRLASVWMCWNGFHLHAQPGSAVCSLWCNTCTTYMNSEGEWDSKISKWDSMGFDNHVRGTQSHCIGLTPAPVHQSCPKLSKVVQSPSKHKIRGSDCYKQLRIWQASARIISAWSLHWVWISWLDLISRNTVN